MKTQILACGIVAAFAASVVTGAPVDDVKAAAKKLADAPNYSWTSTAQNAGGAGQMGGGPTTGVAEKGGYAVITRQMQNGPMKTVAKGDKRVIETPNGWRTMEEMRAQGGGQGSPRGGQGGPRGGGAMGAQPLPADEIHALIAGIGEFAVVDGVHVATLSPETVAGMMRFGGRGGNQASGTSTGTLKVWLKDGVMVKTELAIRGSMPGRDGGTRRIDRTTVTEFKNIGTTKVEVPAEAKAKLES